MKHLKIRDKFGAVLVYALLFLFFAAPLLRLGVMSLETVQGIGIQNYVELLREERTREAIRNTVVIAAASTLLSAAAGSSAAFLMAYTNLKRKELLEMLLLLPFVIPSYIITLSWSGLLSRQGLINRLVTAAGLEAINIYSVSGIILVIGICNTPIVYMSVVHMLRKIPMDMEWASKTCGFGTCATLLRINLAEALPAVVSGSLLAFLSAIDNFSVPAFLGISSGIPVLSTYIYEKAISFGPDAFPAAAALSVLLSVIAVGGTLLEGMLVGKRSAMESMKEDHTVRIWLASGWRKGIEWGLLAFLGFINIVPLLNMIYSSFQKTYGLRMSLQNFSVKNFSFVLTNRGAVAAVCNSLLLAAATSLICIVLGMVCAYLKIRKNSVVMKTAEKCASLTYAVPGIVLSLAMIFHWVEPVPGFRPGIYGTMGILAVAYVTRYLVLQIKGSATALLAIDPALEEAVRVSGRGKIALWREVMLPLLTGPVLSSAFLIFVPALTELTLSSMLAGAGTKTIGLTIFNYQQSGDYNLSAALSSIVVLFILAGYGLTHLKIRGMHMQRREQDELVSGTACTAV